MCKSWRPPYLDAISSSGRTLLALINDILDLSKIEAGKLNLEYEPVCVARLVEEIQKLFSIKAGEKGIKLLTEVDPDLPRGLLLDEVRLRQVLFNVVGNAIKFTETGHVTIRAAIEPGSLAAEEDRANQASENRSAGPAGAAPEDAHAEERVTLLLEVQDTGIGIPQDQLESLTSRTWWSRSSFCTHVFSQGFYRARRGETAPKSKGLSKDNKASEKV